VKIFFSAADRLHEPGLLVTGLIGRRLLAYTNDEKVKLGWTNCCHRLGDALRYTSQAEVTCAESKARRECPGTETYLRARP
jgi:hypothetical protein